MDFGTYLFERGLQRAPRSTFESQRLIFNTNTLETIYAQLNKTQISKFVTDWGGAYILIEEEDREYSIDFRVSCLSPLENSVFANFCLRLGFSPALFIYLLFDGQKLKIQSVKIVGGEYDPIQKKAAAKNLKLIEKYLNTKVLECLLSPEFSFSLASNDWERRKYPKVFLIQIKGINLLPLSRCSA